MYLPFKPLKGQQFTLYFTSANTTTSDPVAASSLAYINISKDGAAFVPTANSVIDIAIGVGGNTSSAGRRKLVLTATEMDADVIILAYKSFNGPVFSSEIIYTTTETIPSVNVTKWNSTSVPTEDIAGQPKVTLSSGQLAIKKNTNLNNFEFLMIDSSDNKTPKTGLTVVGQVSIDGASFVDLVNSVSEVGSGIYKVNLTSNDLNGTTIMLKFVATGANPRYILIITQA